MELKGSMVSLEMESDSSSTDYDEAHFHEEQPLVMWETVDPVCAMGFDMSYPAPSQYHQELRQAVNQNEPARPDLRLENLMASTPWSSEVSSRTHEKSS
jgi:hypothetical protein